ncbi:MAG: low molecular weight protein-tyrosine-phosphatase [Pseudomonadota bacterium]
MRLVCVCRGNLCRSPMAAAVLRTKLQRAGLDVRIESAGTATWHRGDPAEPEAVATAADRGYTIGIHRARRIVAEDFDADLLLAMDVANIGALERLAPISSMALLEPFHPTRDIDDPYYGGRPAFEAALDLIEDAADIVVARLVAAEQSVSASLDRARRSAAIEAWKARRLGNRRA